MAVMGSRKQMVRRIIENRRTLSKEEEAELKRKQEEANKPISEEEHIKRIQKLRDLGLIK